VGASSFNNIICFLYHVIAIIFPVPVHRRHRNLTGDYDCASCFCVVFSMTFDFSYLDDDNSCKMPAVHHDLEKNGQL